MKPSFSNTRKPWKLLAMGFLLVSFASGQEAKPDGEVEQPPADVGSLEKLKLPGLTLHAEARHIDVDATVCLDAGYLELIACMKDSKEHESIIAVNAKAAHIHAALLLLRANPGSPAMMRRTEDGRWIDITASGSEVDVYLVFKDDKGEMNEHPISKFIQRIKGEGDIANATGRNAEENGRFPTHTFLFAGSRIEKGEGGKARYLSDINGNVISLSSFGDELLCLPGKHSQDNAALSWEIDPEHLPPVGTNVILRLKPKQAAPAGPGK